MRFFVFLLMPFLAIPSLLAQTEITSIPWKKLQSETQTFMFAEAVNGGQGTRLVMNEPGYISTLLLDEQFREVTQQRLRKPSSTWNISFRHVLYQHGKILFFFKDREKHWMRATADFFDEIITVDVLDDIKAPISELAFTLGRDFFLVRWGEEGSDMILHQYVDGTKYRTENIPVPFEGFFDKYNDNRSAVTLIHQGREVGLERCESVRKLYARAGKLLLTYEDHHEMTTRVLEIDLAQFSTTAREFAILQPVEEPLFTLNSCVYQNRLYQVAVNKKNLWVAIKDLDSQETLTSDLFLDDVGLMEVFDSVTYRKNGRYGESIHYEWKLIDQLDKRLAISVTDLIPGEDLLLLRIGTPWTGSVEEKIIRTTLAVAALAGTVVAMGSPAIAIGDNAYITYSPDYYLPDLQYLWAHRVEVMGKTDPQNFAYVEGVVAQDSLRPLLAELPTPRIQEAIQYLEANKLENKARAMTTFVKEKDFILVYWVKKQFYVVKF